MICAYLYIISTIFFKLFKKKKDFLYLLCPLQLPLKQLDI